MQKTKVLHNNWLMKKAFSLKHQSTFGDQKGRIFDDGLVEYTDLLILMIFLVHVGFVILFIPVVKFSWFPWFFWFLRFPWLVFMFVMPLLVSVVHLVFVALVGESAQWNMCTHAIEFNELTILATCML